MLNVLSTWFWSGQNRILFEAVTNLRKESCNINVIQYCSEELDKNEEVFSYVLKEISSVDFIIINLHGSVPYFKKFPRLRETINSEKCPVFLISTIEEEMTEYRSWFPFSNDDYRQVYSISPCWGVSQNMNFFASLG